LKSEKNEKYVFSNTGLDSQHCASTKDQHQQQYPQLESFISRFVGIFTSVQLACALPVKRRDGAYS